MGRGRFVLRPAVGRVPAPFAIACNGRFVLHSRGHAPLLALYALRAKDEMTVICTGAIKAGRRHFYGAFSSP